MIQRCNIHQRDIFQTVVAAQAVHQSVGGIHGGDAGDAQLHGLAAQADGIAFGVAALGTSGEDIVHQTALQQVHDVGRLAGHIAHLVAGHHVLVEPCAGAGGAVQLVAHALELPCNVHELRLVAVLHGEDAAACGAGGLEGVARADEAVTAGVAYDEEDEPVLYLNGIDHVWIEFMALLLVGFIYGGRIGYDYLMNVANKVYLSHSEIQGREITRLTAYGVFALYGFCVSLGINVFWYSLIRRIKSHNMWSDSFLHWIVTSFGKAVHFVVSHRNSAISSLIPYNLFLLVNLAGIFGAYLLRGKSTLWVLPALGAIVLDGIVGVLRFKQKAEQIDIVEGIRRIRDGEVDYKLDVESLHGDNREMADAVNNIGEGIRKAVSTSMKDEQMKSDLITNVSHDIKTPLTSIINYVDLLKRLKITEEPARSYIEVLDSKSQRLKQLTDDLVEASKISSGNIVLNLEQLNLTELLNQAVGEFSDRMEEKKLQVIFDGNDVAGMIYADSRRMWRIIENLFQNICKYALEGTRVYLEMQVKDGRVIASLKNISDRPMNLKGEELSERFIRGDASRTTEGSGLGLYIAKNLTKAQHGEFQIQLDGDLFKIILDFPEYHKPEEPATEQLKETVSKEV